MAVYELVDQLIEDGYSSVWFYRSRLLTDENELPVMFLLMENGKEVARRIYAPGVNEWSQTIWPKAPIFTALPENVSHIDLTDPVMAGWDIDMLDSEYALMDSRPERIK